MFLSRSSKTILIFYLKELPKVPLFVVVLLTQQELFLMFLVVVHLLPLPTSLLGDYCGLLPQADSSHSSVNFLLRPEFVLPFYISSVP